MRKYITHGAGLPNWASPITHAFGNLFAAVRAAEFSVDDITFIDIAFVDLADLPEANALYAELFPEGRRSARTIYQAAALPFGARVKVMGVAAREQQERVAG